MKQPVKVLIVEDSEDDELLVLDALRRGGFDPKHLRVTNAEAMEHALRTQAWDVVLADFNLPTFDALSAFRLFKQFNHDVPFIIVSGSIGEDTAVDALKHGVSDYLLKQNLTRLASSVQHELRSAHERRQRRKIEEDLRNITERLTTVAHVTSDAIWDWDLSSNKLWWSDGLEKLFGWAPDELEEGLESWTNRIHPDEFKAVVDGFHAVTKGTNREWRAEYRFRRKDGSYAFVLDRGQVIRDAKGKPFRMVGGMTDITALKHAEEALSQSEKIYREMFQGNPLPMWVYDQQSLRFLAVNDAAVQQYGHTREQFLALTIRDIRPSDELPRLAEHLKNPVADRPHVGFWRHIKRDGTLIDVETRSHTLKFDGRDARLVMASDITERLQNELRMQEQAALLNKAQDAIIVRNLDATIRFWNKGAEHLYGWTEAEALGMSADTLLHKDNRKLVEANQIVRQRGEWFGELTQMTKSGGEIVVESRWTLVNDSHGQPQSILTINTDVTEKKRLETQFLRAQRMESIGTLAGGIAHDLNNVLSPILMAVSLLRDKLPDEESQLVLNMLDQSAQRGADMVRQVLTFARGVEGQRLVVQPRHLVKDIEKICRDTFAKNLRIRTQIAKNLKAVTGDPTQLHQVLLNLCVNARDAMPSGGELSITCENVVIDSHYATMHPEAHPGEYVLVKVSDTGTGIPAEIRDRIFEPFFTTKEVGKGTGLGLSTVMAIIKSHGGFINLYSEIGNGTTFKVYIPTGSDQTQVTPEDKPVQLPRGAGELILVVDDEASVRTVTKQTLEAFGYRVMVAGDGAEAVTVFVQHRLEIAAVLTDMAMPVMDGPATIHALQRLDPHVRLIAASGLGTDANVSKALGMGVKHFLPKPYTADTLLQALREVLSSRPVSVHS